MKLSASAAFFGNVHVKGEWAMECRLLILGLVLVLLSCAGVPRPSGVSAPPGEGEDRRADLHLRHLLDQGGSQLDYPALMALYAAMSRADRPIDDMHGLLADMIRKRNDHPRVDQMILIFAAKAIGESPFSIPRVGDLFTAMLHQPERLNEWVISFVADAIGRYPFEIAQGDHLMDRLEAESLRIRNAFDPSAEMFGYHFLPPPRHPLVQSYLSKISDQGLRTVERNRYYTLIQRNIPEDDIAASLSYLQARENTGAIPACSPMMRCLLRMQAQLPLK